MENENEPVVSPVTIIDPYFDMENYLYNKFKQYLTENSKYKLNIFNKSPQRLVDFPTITFEEVNNRDVIQNRSLNVRGREIVSSLTYRVEIYTTDKTINNEKVMSKVMLSYLKQLVFNFFEYYGFNRTDCTKGETSDYQVDRLIILEQIQECNWNRGID